MTHYESGYTVENDKLVGELLAILTVQHCRPVLRYFRESTEEGVSVPELASEVSGEANPEQVAIHLQHSTLPRLSEVGVIDYDTRTDTVRYQGRSDLEALLDAIREYKTDRVGL